MSPRWLHWPAAAAASDYADYFIAGSGYWIIPDATTTAQISKTGGDAVVAWTVIRHDFESGNSTTVQSGGTVTMDSSFANVIQGGFSQLTNPYNYCAAWFDGTGTGAGDPRTSGWIVYEREQTAGALVGGRQSFLPIEVQNGVCGSGVTGSGFGPSWNLTGFDDSLVFFFNSYSAGSVQSWSAWDGVTTP